eukprot:scaffold584246_cov42-Prasinocladus_malaysianus.AAC.1
MQHRIKQAPTVRQARSHRAVFLHNESKQRDSVFHEAAPLLARSAADTFAYRTQRFPPSSSRI